MEVRIVTTSIIFSISSFIYILLIGCIYFSKKKVKNNENKFYSLLIISNFLGLFIEVGSTIIRYYFPDFNFLFSILLRFIVVYFVTWPFLFLLYIISVCKQRKVHSLLAIIIYIIEILFAFFLPLYIKQNGNIVLYTYGPSVIFTYFIVSSDMLICLYLVIKYKKIIGTKKTIPVIAFLFMGVISYIVSKMKPELL